MSDNNSNETNQLLQGAVESLADDVNNQREEAYKALNHALEGNAKMMRLFGELLEKSYVTKVQLSSEIKPTEDGSIQIDLTINNSTPFPILSMTGEFDFGGADVEIFCTKDSVFESNINVNKFTKEVESIRIKSTQDEPMYGKGVVRVQYPHPLNAKELKLEHSFGVYVIDQLFKTSVDKSKAYKFEAKFYPVKFIREIMKIHPIKGIDIGMCVELSRKNFKVVCEIIKFSDDLELAQVEFSSDSDQECRFKSRLIEELDALSR
ncbi:hypothetical protein MFLAVUS_004363 [Mucor flavus]|uniref:Uncharacterized protein n=1 Tax=Mucor flavus TaxID=439312 RepID=A0ABP9YVT4_9FUNG